MADADVLRLQEEIVRYRTLLDAANVDKDKLAVVIDEKESETMAARGEARSLRTRVEAVERDLSETRRREEASHAAHQDVTDRLTLTRKSSDDASTGHAKAMSEAREELARAEAEKASVAAAADAAASKAKAAAAEAASSDSQATAHAAAAKQVKASHAELEEEHNALQGRVSAILEQAKQAKQAAEKLEKSLDECKKERTKALEGERTAVNAAAALREAAEAEKAARLAAEANDSAGQQTQLQELMEEGHALAIRKDAAHKSELSRLEEELKSATAKADTSASELESKSKAATRQEAALREDAARVQALLDQLGAEHERELAEAHAMLSESGDEKLRDAVQQLERSQAEKAALGKQAEVAERSAEGASRALASLQSDHSRVLSSNSALTAECKTYREEVAAKAKQVAELTSEVDALNAKVRKKAEEVQTQISARKDRIAIMTADYTKLEKSWKLSRDFEQTFLNAQLSDKEILKMVKDHVRAMSHGEP